MREREQTEVRSCYIWQIWWNVE